MRLPTLPFLVLLLVAPAASCGSDDQTALQTLPPIRTTTSTTTTTTLPDERTRLYTVKEGENLSMIAKSFQVPLQTLIDANADQITDPNNVQPGVMLEIPPVVVVDVLPTVASTSAPTATEPP